MDLNWKRVAAALLVLVLLVPLSLSCGDDGDGGKVTITIGQLTDFTGPGAPAIKNITYVTQDVAKHYNDEELIPGVRVKIAAYDTKFDPARYPLGYEWCKMQGAEVVITITADPAELLKPFAEKDKVVIAAMGAVEELFEPPEWVFGFSSTVTDSMKTLFRWVSDNVWDGQGTPRIGAVGWRDEQSMDALRAVEEYTESHPEQFDYVGAYTSPVGTMNFTMEAGKLADADCDYVAVISGYMGGFFLRDFREAGGTARLLDCIGSIGSYRKFYSDLVGWEMLDGFLSTQQSLYWTDEGPIVELLTELVHRYRSGEADEIIAGGNGYVGAGHMVVGIFEVLEQAVAQVGAENFDGQAYFDACLNYKTTSAMWEGYYPEYEFTETRRLLMDHAMISGYDAEAEDYVGLSGWLPNVE